MDFLIGLFLACLAGYLLREFCDWAINKADEQERQAKRDKGFITPPSLITLRGRRAFISVLTPGFGATR